MDYADWHTTRPAPAELKEARRNARLSPDEAADLCGLHRTSYARQESGQSRASTTVYRLIMMHAGWLPPPFDGWSLARGKIWTPEDVSFDPGEIRAIPYLYALIAELKRQTGRDTHEHDHLYPQGVVL